MDIHFPKHKKLKQKFKPGRMAKLFANQVFKKSIAILLFTYLIVLINNLILRHRFIISIPTTFYYFLIFGCVFASLILYLLNYRQYSKICFGLALICLFPYPIYNVDLDMFEIFKIIIGAAGFILFPIGLWEVLPGRDKLPPYFNQITRLIVVFVISLVLLLLSLFLMWGPIIMSAIPIGIILLVTLHIWKQRNFEKLLFGTFLQFFVWVGIFGFFETPENVIQNLGFLFFGCVGYLLVISNIWHFSLKVKPLITLDNTTSINK